MEKKSAGYYFNLLSEIKKQRNNTTAYTAATTLIIGLREMLGKLKEDGFDSLYAKTARRADATRKALHSIGLEVYPLTPANAMTTIYNDNANEIRDILKKRYGVNIAGGQDHLKGKIFRINHMGLVEDYELSWVVNAIELALDEMGIRSFSSTANKILVQNLFIGSK